MAHRNSYLYDTDLSLLRSFCLERGTHLACGRRDRFQRAGAPVERLAYIARGGVWYACCGQDGREHVVGYGFEGGFAVDYAALLRGVPGVLDIRTFGDTELYAVGADEFRAFVDRDDRTRALARRMGEGLFVALSDRLLEFYTCTPAERYARLLERCPDLPERLTMREIASFVGVTPEALCRIRRRMLGR